MTVFSTEAIAEAIATRQHLHANPELKYEEHATAELVASRLRGLGYDVSTGLAETGVVAILDTGRPGPTIAFRADMDALPIIEETGLAYASRNPGKMHACGHDGHTASLLLAANGLAGLHDRLSGKIKLLFQPAEEGGLGAARMIEAGALKGVDAIYGYHNRPGYPLGRVFAKTGPAMGGSTLYDVTISGKGGHASRPDLAVDPIFVGTAVVQGLQSVISRRLSPLESGVVTVTQFHGGNSHNIIPVAVKLSINTRDGSPAAYELIDRELRHVVTQICDAHGAVATVEQQMRIPPVVNDADETDFTVATAIATYGPDKAGRIDTLPTMGAEDFAFYLERVPGCFFFVGNGEDGAYLHHPLYNYRDEILPVAAGMFLAIAERRLASSGQAVSNVSF
ncbi:amidohydrolase [Phyllobacterium sp. OV277]|uniref:M20 metallopeptidase family protein n=1 Tax=Phyllobacterium sp. OV277 TaxID=1882772 RepID=UPI00088E2D8E|nr:amidohydrolase [Phyllobacterium sp. OV277]SDP85641.1 hippurate hydrolase [Phyllobacterium sp. OV277]